MKFDRSEIVFTILTFSGFVSFIFNYPVYSPLLLVPLIIFLKSLVSVKTRRSGIVKLFFPYSSGLLIFVMRLFYWDGFDFSKRVGNLLLISLVFLIFSAVKKYGTIGKFNEYFNSKTIRIRILILFIFTQAVFLAASGILVTKGVELVGDEPHYLAISHSIAKDGDLNVFNQYARDEYRDFIKYRLAHHSKVGKGFKKWYSFHLPGLSFTLAPFFLIKIPLPILYLLVRVFLGLFGSILGIMVYLITLKLWKREKLSLFVFTVFMFTAPVFFYSIHIFAELQVLLLLLLSIWFSLFKDKIRERDILFAGFFLGITVFWGMKYLIFILVLTILFLFQKFRKNELRSGMIFAVFPVFFIILFFLYVYFAYGSFSPMSVYTGVLTEAQRAEYIDGMKSIKIQNRVETLFDYFFDQRDGLIPYNPFYLFFFPGLILALKKFKKYYPHIMISAASFIYLIYHGYSTVRPGYCPQARYLLPVVWTLMLFSVIYHIESRNRFFKKIFIYIPLYSFFITLFQIFNPFTLYQSTTHNYLDRSGLLFQKLGNIYFDISRAVPSFIKVEGNFKYLPNLIFLALFLLFLYFSLKSFDLKKFRSVPVCVFLTLFAVFSLFPRPYLYNPKKVKTKSGLSFLVHGNLYPKSDTLKEFVLEVRDSNPGIITISTIKKLTRVNFYFSGQKNSGKITVTNFDREPEVFTVQEEQIRNITIRDPHYKKIKARYYYTFNFRHCYRLVEGLNIKVEPI